MKRAFTFVEVLIVICIIGLLTAIAVHVRTRALATKVQTRTIKDIHVVDPDTVSITFAGDTVVSNIFGRPVSFQINEDTGTYTWFEIQQAQLYCNQGITNLENPQRAVTLPAKTRP